MRICTMTVRFCAECPHCDVSDINNDNSGYCWKQAVSIDNVYEDIPQWCPLPEKE